MASHLRSEVVTSALIGGFQFKNTVLPIIQNILIIIMSYAYGEYVDIFYVMNVP
jgi:hypothetical protein